MPTSQQDEAIQLLSEALSNLTSPNKDIKSVLRKCQHVCELLGWEEQKKWFHQELNGYDAGSTLPFYRRIAGIRRFDIGGSAYDRSQWLAQEMVDGVETAIYDEKEDVLEVWVGIDWFIAASGTGYIEVLPEQKKVPHKFKSLMFTLHRARAFTAPSIANSLAQIEKQTYDFISQTYVQLKYGNRIREIWDEYRTRVDKALLKLGLSHHLSAIEANLTSGNPEAWREAAFECRNMLNDLANYLWRDLRNRYEHLPGKTDDGKLDVSQGKFGNRLAAYIHQKGISGTQGEYLRAEADRLASSIQSLISYQSEAHEPLSLQTARSIAIASYVLLGEILTRTDLIPVETYKDPVINN